MNKPLFSLLSLSRFHKRVISVLIDVFGLVIASYLAICIRFGEASHIEPYLLSISILVLIAIPVFIYQGLYRAVIRYIGHKFANTVFFTVSTVFVLWTSTLFMLDLPFPRTAILIDWLLVLLFIAATRLIARRLLFSVAQAKTEKHPRQNIVIFGAGSSGRQLFNAILKIPHIYAVGFIDDDKNLQNQEISCARVYKRDDLAYLIDKYQVTDVFLAIPSLKASQRKDVIEWLEPFQVKVSSVPGIDEIVSGKIRFSDIREVDIGDLLGRDVVGPHPDLLAKCIAGQSVLVTGAGGSIGSELCRQILAQRPKRLVLLELSEFALYSIDKELTKLSQDSACELIPVLGSVRDELKLKRLLVLYGVDTVYHAAAYKHVPIVEHNLQEGIFNNTFGTHTTAKAAGEVGVKNFVLISTDKAVRPTNVMGASKRMAELALQALQPVYPKTHYSMVRFGNVLGSSGSVIPLFRKQISNGGPVTVTHPEMTRYFMTIPEAASLVIQAGSMGVGGEVYVLDMGDPVKIDLLARKIIRLSGLEVMDSDGHGDIEICYTGLRPGEKLYEELLIGDNPDGTEHPRIMKANEYSISYIEFTDALHHLEVLLENQDYVGLLEAIGTVVKGFQHTGEIVDYSIKP
ncbi:nucleotide sugar epimerase/dehydratase WbpM [Thiosulfatimonas sediminis]|uniref:Nucleotide sugar epimerase/dehydratase WbpM n=1 Tax=Thiosulfatimonas sediminis TaxID=2675054 RepID=A0A6F8PTF3_9GAMM|nr:nucleoside-diphosphate sugar epimerase/dehydratase [Thiosulfatimonas sediminis]BBP45288.1 nucleotide sugar epimerase/dehydratase WbpM [Thiosulfatimonas sediminis]